MTPKIIIASARLKMLRPKNKKFKVAIISLTSCDGCQVALLDLGQRFLELFKK